MAAAYGAYGCNVAIDSDWFCRWIGGGLRARRFAASVAGCTERHLSTAYSDPKCAYRRFGTYNDDAFWLRIITESALGHTGMFLPCSDCNDERIIEHG